MLEPLLIGVALCTALIIAAALVAIRHWRRGSGYPVAPAGPARKAMAPREIAIVPGFSDTVPPDSGAHMPVQPGWVAHSQARPAGPQPYPRGPGPPPNGRRATARAVTTSEQIASYYDQADRPMADYLTALGWTHQPVHTPESPGPAERARRHPPPSGATDSKTRGG